MQAKRITVTLPQAVILVVLFAALVVAFYPLLVSLAMFIESWLTANHATINAVMIACIGHGC
jgi:hypothetical protein